MVRNPETQSILPDRDVGAAKVLSPRRTTTQAASLEGLAREQLAHFNIDGDSPYGQALYQTALDLYRAQADVSKLWTITMDTLRQLSRKDRLAYFNAKKFLCFQLAKVLDTLQNPFRKSYQSLSYSNGSLCARGPYPLFDNVTALFSSNPVIVRTATYIFACTEWVDEAFQGKEMLHEIYSRLLNPTSISLANHIVDIEAGPYACDYLAWNFNSGMAAIDALLSNLLGHRDVLVASRNVYGGTYQLMHDHYARSDKLDVALEWFDGYTQEEFAGFLAQVKQRQAKRLQNGARLHVFVESPCNPHGYVLDVPGICRTAHAQGHLVALDATVGTPFLFKPLQHEDKRLRPDYVIHSYTKDLTGNGNATAGVVIGENHRMFCPKDETVKGVPWHKTLFWDVYYIKGAFLDADKAFEVISGMKTLSLRMMKKCVNTVVLANVLNSHPGIRVNCNAVAGNPNYALRAANLKFGLSAPLFTIDFEKASLSSETFKRFFDSLAPTFDHQVSLGQSNTVVLCPALTSHSELDPTALREAGIFPTTIRIAVGNETPQELIAHFIHAARLAIDPDHPGFSKRFMPPSQVDQLIKNTYLDVHRQYIESQPTLEELLA